MDALNDRQETIVCTIVSKNYLAFARTLMNSAATVHPEWKRYVLLVDEVDGRFDAASENFEVVHVSQLDLPEPQKFLFRYSILELNTAVKPWFLQWLFERTAAQNVVYLDPDIRVYAPLTDMERLLRDGALMTLTPHLLAEVDDDRRPGEHDILQAGCYNLGFLGLSRHPELPRFLSWWRKKLTYDCRVDLAQGLFVDQKWMDLAPGLFSDVAVLRHPGYNVAYWNLANRRLRHVRGRATIDDQPLVFFHFSGLDPLSPASFSKHQNRFRLQDLGACEAVVKEYCQEVVGNGHRECRGWPYAFGVLSNGDSIATCMRQLYRSNADFIRRAGADPFEHDHAYLNESVDDDRQPLITRLMYAYWESRADLRDAFPDVLGEWREAFANHFLEFGATQAGVSESFMTPVRNSLESWRAHASSRYAATIPRLNAQSRDFVHPITWSILCLLRLMSCVLPVPRSPEKLRQYYNIVRPMRVLLPSRVRQQLRRELIRMLHRRESVKKPKPLIDRFKAVCQWLASPLRNLRAAGAALNTAAPITPPSAFHKTRTPALKPGFNIVGYVESRSGVGESARLCAQAASAVGLSHSVHDVTFRTAFDAPEPPGRHAVNLMHVNADQTAVLRESLGTAFSRDRYNIGVWHWELPRFPDRWLSAFDELDEIWAPSRFIQDALSACSPRPIIRIPHAIRFNLDGGATRRDFGLPEGDVLFLMMFDVQSFRGRKNPEGAVEAFRRAFAGVKGVRLVVKINDSQSNLLSTSGWEALSKGVPNVHVVEESMTRQRTYDLISVCDCFVSLHHAEGYGLVLAESMYLGKPVIATGWSGNMDFMTSLNSCPVDYRLTPLKQDVGPYDRGQIWAEPNLDHAADLMQRVASDPTWARRIAAAGRATILNDFSPEKIGALYQDRLAVICNQRPLPRSMPSAA